MNEKTEIIQVEPEMKLGIIPARTPHDVIVQATVREKVRDKAAKHQNFEPSDKQQALLRHALELCFVGDDASEDKRHTVLRYLTGQESTKDVNGQEFKAIIEDWLQVDKDSGGEYTVNELSRKEAQAIYTAALKAEGQQELL